VDCSTLSPTLLESELFGYEKGAFTGADRSKKGRIQEADTGTLFMDEVNNLSLDTQSKILGFLQDRSITPVGGTQPIPLNLRVLVASNVPLEELIEQGVFREDLYFRINIVTLKLPSLKERRDDIPVLSDYFVRLFALQHKKEISGLTHEAHQKIQKGDWPGNIRELKNTIHRAVIFCETDKIGEHLIEMSGKDLLIKRKGKKGFNQDKTRTKKIDKKTLVGALLKTGGNVQSAAANLGKSRLALY